MERSKGFSSWIRFGEKSLSYLLEGVEAWCRRESSSWCLKVWEEGGRKFRLKCRSNEASRFLLCLVRDLEAKRLSRFSRRKRLSKGVVSVGSEVKGPWSFHSSFEQR